MKCLITGVAGFIGSNLLTRLLSEGWDVTGLDDLSHGFIRNVEPHLADSRFRFVQGDVRDSGLIVREADGADVIVHLAAGKIPRYGNSIETIETNTLGGRNVLEAARVTKSRVVIASTSDVYGMSDDLPFREDGRLVLGAPTVRRWAYATSKLIDEHLALAHRESYGTDVVLLRFFGSYGENQNTTWWGGPQSVFIAATLKGEEMELHGDGLQTRSFTYVGDTVEGVRRAMTSPGAPGEILNIGNDREITIAGLARMVSQLIRPGQEPALRIVPYAAFGKYEDVRRRVPDIRKSKEILGFQAKVPLEEGLPRAIRWQAAAMGLALPPGARV